MMLRQKTRSPSRAMANVGMLLLVALSLTLFSPVVVAQDYRFNKGKNLCPLLRRNFYLSKPNPTVYD